MSAVVIATKARPERGTRGSPEEGPGSPRVPATRLGGAYGVIRRPLRPARNVWRVVEQRFAPSPAAALWNPTVTCRRPALGSTICARFPWVRRRTLPSRMSLIFRRRHAGFGHHQDTTDAERQGILVLVPELDGEAGRGVDGLLRAERAQD